MTFKKFVLYALLFVIFATITLAGLGYYAYKTLPDISQLKGCLTSSMNQVRLCPQNPNYVSLSQIADVAENAIVLSEDAAFYGHDGFDWFEIKQSIERNLEEGGFARGGSTITQQLAKNVFLEADKNLIRKFKEAILAHQMEEAFSKNLILERYLNVVEFGPNIYGIKQAASYYFNKHPRSLNALEGAFLAFLLPNPKGYHQSFKNRQLTDFARKRVLHILYLLSHYKRISANTYEASKQLVDLFPWTSLDPSDFNNYMPELPTVENEWQQLTPEELEEEQRRVKAELDRAIDEELEKLGDEDVPSEAEVEKAAQQGFGPDKSVPSEEESNGDVDTQLEQELIPAEGDEPSITEPSPSLQEQ